MSANIVEFHRRVVEIYNDEVGDAFMAAVGTATELPYSDALNALDRALMGDSLPVVSGFGKPTSRPSATKPKTP